MAPINEEKFRRELARLEAAGTPVSPSRLHRIMQRRAKGERSLARSNKQFESRNRLARLMRQQPRR